MSFALNLVCFDFRFVLSLSLCLRGGAVRGWFLHGAVWLCGAVPVITNLVLWKVGTFPLLTSVFLVINVVASIC